jgi:ABC-2 type transport system ATP-binding protein
MNPALHLDHLEKTFPPREKTGQPVRAVQGISLEIQPGEIFALLGPNGAGKSTTIGMISGLVNPTGGTAKVFGKDVVNDYKQTRQMIGLVPQEVNFDPFFTPREALEIQAGLFNVEKKDRWTDEILKRLSLTSVADTSVRKLSGGMKRRLLVGKALVHRPKLLILDEPTAGVDVELRRELWDFVRELNKNGTTILLTTHHMEEVEALSGRIAIIAKGELKAIDTLAGHKKTTGIDKLEDIYLKYTSV